MFNVMFILVPVLAFGIMIFVFLMIFSGKTRSKFMGHQLNMQKQMLEDNKETIKDIAEISGEIGIKSKRNIMDNNEEDLRHMATMGADISKDAIRTTTSAIREGLTGDNSESGTGSSYCKHCGAKIDSDSKFCKKCGKEQ